MNKTFKKLISFVLVLALSLTAFAGVFSVFAEESTSADTTTAAAENTPAEDEGEEEYSKTTFFELIVRFWQSVGSFFKYIFYDVLLGKAAPEIPPVPNHRYF